MPDKITRDRKARKGADRTKIAKIWAVLERRGDWIHIAEIARQTGINEVTVRWYLDHHMVSAVEQTRFAPTIRLRMVRLRPGIKLSGFLKAVELIQSVKEPPIQTAFAPREESVKEE